MVNLVEFKVSKTIFDDVKNDPGFRFGFEAEFHVENASSVLRDQSGQLPRGFQTYNTLGTNDTDPFELNQFDVDALDNFDVEDFDQFEDSYFHEDETLIRLCRLFESHLGLGAGDIEHGTPHVKSDYRQWKLTTDASLYTNTNQLINPDHDMGVELVSPIMTLREGLVMMTKVSNMIATFEAGDVRTYTTDMCSMHVNLSHVLMEHHFDYAKLAIMGGDEHYLAAFNRIANRYSQPILRAVYDELVAAKEGRPKSPNSGAALNLLNLQGWDARRVMYDLSTLIPLDHHMSIDFRRVTSDNPYVEFRMAGNAGYEQRYDDIAKMVIRYAALIKIACDPNAHRDEYMKKVYQLVSGVAPGPAKPPSENQLPRIRVFLQPIMSRATRTALDQIETYLNAQSLTIPNAGFLFLTVLRSSIDMRLAENLRIRQGLNMLLKAMRLAPADLMKNLKSPAMLMRYGVMRANEKPAQTIAMLTNTIKSLNQPVTRQAMMAAARTRALQAHQQMLHEDDMHTQRIKKRLAEKQRAQAKKERPKPL